MTRRKLSILICSAVVLGCGRSQTAKRAEQNYQVVQEGQASGVTSTINGPGETPPPITDTNVDTTTNFTLPDNPAPLGTQPPNTVAGTLPSAPVPPPSYPQPSPTAAPRPVQRATPVAAPPMSSNSPA